MRQTRAGRVGVLYSPETILLREKSDSEPSPQLEKDCEIHVVTGVTIDANKTALPKWHVSSSAGVSSCKDSALMNAMGPKIICFGSISLGISDISYSLDSTERR